MLFSCHQPDQKSSAATLLSPDSTASTKRDTSTPNLASTPGRDTMIKTPTQQSTATASTLSDTSVVATNITDWQEFWRLLKTAVRKKDTVTIIGMTYFPFYNNSSPDSKADWKEEVPDDIFKISKENELPSFIGERSFGGTDYKTNIYSHIKCDSVFLIAIPRGEIYFGKMQGSYKLLGKLDPG
jgi:hypothetical protein